MSMKRTCAISSSISFLISVDTDADCRELARARPRFARRLEPRITRIARIRLRHEDQACWHGQLHESEKSASSPVECSANLPAEQDLTRLNLDTRVFDQRASV